MNVWSIKIILLYIWYSVIVQLIVCTRPDHTILHISANIKYNLIFSMSFLFFFSLFKNTLKILSTFFPNYTKKIFITYINSKQFKKNIHNKLNWKLIWTDLIFTLTYPRRQLIRVHDNEGCLIRVYVNEGCIYRVYENEGRIIRVFVNEGRLNLSSR